MSIAFDYSYNIITMIKIVSFCTLQNDSPKETWLEINNIKYYFLEKTIWRLNVLCKAQTLKNGEKDVIQRAVKLTISNGIKILHDAREIILLLPQICVKGTMMQTIECCHALIQVVPFAGKAFLPFL